MNKLKNTQLSQVKILICEIIEEAEKKRTSWRKMRSLIDLVDYKTKTYEIVWKKTKHNWYWLQSNCRKRDKTGLVIEANGILESLKRGE